MKMYSRTAGKKLMALILCAIMMITMLPPGAKVSQAATSVSNPRTANGVSTWDCIYFGNYYQSNSSTKEPIKWRVLSVKGNEAFVVADMALDCQSYNETDEDVTWETCTLRQWLNSTFLDAAFDAEEKSAITTTNVVNEDNISFGTAGGNTTSDKIFLLSQNEVKNPSYGFNSKYGAKSETRQCKASTYAVENNCWTSSSDGSAGNCWWWLRSPGFDSFHAANVDFDGEGWGYSGNSVFSANDGVRPALNLNLSSSSWKYAGTVSANVGEGSGENPTVTKKPVVTLKPDAVSDDTAEGTSGSLVIGEDQSGAADSSSGVSQFFPASWSLKSTKYPLELAKTVKADGTYTIKGSIGIGRSDLLNTESEWNKYKAACNKANQTMSEYDTLYAYKDMFGLKSSTAVHCTGWSGSAKPQLSVMGYVENTYDVYGNLIKAEGRVAGEMAWKGGATWNFATPVGPMYLKFEAGGKISLSVGPTWDNANKSMSLDGSLKLTPSISLTGGYGLDGVASLSAKGACSLPIDLISKKQKKWGTKGTFKAEASVNLFVLFVIDKTWTLATYQKTLWDSSISVNSLNDDTAKNSVKTRLMSTDFAKKTTKWSGKAKALNCTNAKTLKEGALKSSIPISAQIGDKQVLVWQDYDSSRSVVNSCVLKYSVLEDGNWSEPKAVYDDGFGDSYADLKVINNELCLVWQKQKKEITASDVDTIAQQMGASSEICFAKFDDTTDTFTDIKQLTTNDSCDMLPQFVEQSSGIKIAYISNDGDIYQSSGTNTIKCLDYETNETTELVSTGDAIGKYETFEVNGTVETVYCATDQTETHSMKTTYAEYQYYLDEVFDAENDISVGSLEYCDGNIQAIVNGILYRYDIANDELVMDMAGEQNFDNNAVYVSNGMKAAYVWSSYDEETGQGTIQASMKGSDGHYTNPIDLFDTSGNIARVLAPILDSEGNWRITANEENPQDEIHALTYYAKEESTASALLSAGVNELESDNGETGIDFVYQNKGDSPVKTIHVKVTAEDGTETAKDIEVNLLPGEILADTAYVDLTEIEKGQNITISIWADDEVQQSDHTTSEYLASANLAVNATASEKDGVITVSAFVENKGTSDAVGSITLYKDVEESASLAKEDNVSCTSGDTKNVDLSVPAEDIVYDANDAAYLPLVIKADGGDYDESDNTVYLALYKGKTVNVDTTPVRTEAVTANDSPATPSLTPMPTAKPTPTVTPIAKPTVTPIIKPMPTSTAKPTITPTIKPTTVPATKPTTKPTAKPTVKPTMIPPLTPSPPAKPDSTLQQTPNRNVQPSQMPVATLKPAVNNQNPVAVSTSITLKKVLSFKARALKKALKLTWRKAPGASGYEIQYSLNKNFKKAKKITIKKAALRKKTIKGLKKNKKYYIRIRATIRKGQRKANGPWVKIVKKTKA